MLCRKKGHPALLHQPASARVFVPWPFGVAVWGYRRISPGTHAVLHRVRKVWGKNHRSAEISMSLASANPLFAKLESARELPTIPAVLIPLLRYMQQPPESLGIHQVVKLISQDKSLSARCLQVANSPLFSAGHQVETIQSAVVALGLNRIQEIAISCSLLRLLPAGSFGVNPSALWAHSLACAMVAQEFALRIGF